MIPPYVEAIAKLLAAVGGYLHAPEVLLRLLALLAALAPVIAGALAAIRSQGELERLVERSRAMSDQLDDIWEQLAAQAPVLSSGALGRAAESAAASMVAEVLDWRLVFQFRPLELAG